jgi:transaldolase
VEKRVLFKIASTAEGIAAARILETKHTLHVNCTLLFSQAQARLAGEAGVTLISPFVGRISDYAKAAGKTWDSPSDDPGVQSVRKIYNYYKARGFKTIVMGASFRNVGQILALAGCDYLTISPKLLQELHDLSDDVSRVLGPAEKVERGYAEDEASPMTVAQFRLAHNEDEMAVAKLAEGIRKFVADTVKLDGLIADEIQKISK